MLTSSFKQQKKLKGYYQVAGSYQPSSSYVLAQDMNYYLSISSGASRL